MQGVPTFCLHAPSVRLAPGFSAVPCFSRVITVCSGDLLRRVCQELEDRVDALKPTEPAGIEIRTSLHALFAASFVPPRAVMGLAWTLVPQHSSFRSVLKALSNGTHATVLEEDVLTKAKRHDLLRTLHGIGAAHMPTVYAKNVSATSVATVCCYAQLFSPSSFLFIGRTWCGVFEGCAGACQNEHY